MNIKLALSIIGFLITNAAQIRQLVVGIQDAVGDILPGEDKATAVKDFIGKALDITDRMDAAWAVARPIFDLFVRAWKTAKAAETAPTAPTAAPAE